MATATGTTKSPHIDDSAEMAHTAVTTSDTHLAANDNDNEGPVREKLKKTSIGTFPKHQTEYAGVQGDKLDVPEAKASAEQSALNSLEPNHDDGDGSHTKSSTTSGKAQEEHITQIDSKENRSSKDVMNDVKNSVSHSSDQEAGHEGTKQSELATTGVQVPSGSRNRDSMSPDSTGHVETMDEDPGARIMPPRKKRSRDQFDNDDGKESEKATAGEERHSRGSEDTERDTQAGNRAARTTREEPEKKRHRDISQGSVSSKEANVSKVRFI